MAGEGWRLARVIEHTEITKGCAKMIYNQVWGEVS